MSAHRRIVIVRHAQTVDNATGTWQGQRDSALSELGVAQVARMAPAVAAMSPAFIVSSDLARASTTAAGIADLLGQQVRVDERLRETHVGLWQGLTNDIVRARWPELVAALDQGQDVPKGETGETRAQVYARADEVIHEIASQVPEDGTVVVVTHGVSGKYAMAALCGLGVDTVDEAFRSLDNCHWAELVEVSKSFSAQTRWRIAAYNRGAESPTPAGSAASIWVP